MLKFPFFFKFLIMFEKVYQDCIFLYFVFFETESHHSVAQAGVNSLIHFNIPSGRYFTVKF